MSQLSVLFKVDDRVLKQRMHGIAPIGKRYNAMIYDVAEVAGRMGKLTAEQVDEAIKRLNHADLPKQLTKEFWAGLRAKQLYEKDAGDLWPTTEVIAQVGEMVKALNMELNLLGDAVERQVEFTPKQRDLLVSMVDGAKSNMLKRLKEKFVVKPTATPAVAAPVPEDDDEL